LSRLFVSLEAIIKSDRENWRLPRKPCCRDATVAIDIYVAAQPGHPDTSDLRRKLKERKRRARIWSELARPSPLIVLMYSGETEPMMYDHRKMDTATLKLLATRILEECPGQFVSLCASLADQAESAVRLGHSIDIHQVAAEKIRQYSSS
ncbi:hypothetical protein C7999DRAFT_18045, partial [Corynascus novoguineensis]